MSSLIETIPYQASGGDSERRDYPNGERLLIEAQSKGYVVAWSAQALGSDFLDIVGQLVDARAVLEDAEGKRRKRSLSKARTMVAGRDKFNAIQVNAKHEIFRWTMHDTYARERHDLTRVALASSAIDLERVTELITKTATPNIKDDLPDIIASIGRLTHTAPAAAT